MMTVAMLEEHGEPIRPGRVAELSHTTPSALSQTFKALEEKGLIERRRAGDDYRAVTVSLTAEGRLQVTDAVKTTRDPGHLSLGTCQQLYLALRIALLMTADNVGRAVPILADDILVNFDTSRRSGAARALAELARMRQVILFTCHEEVVEALREADPTLNEVEL